MNALQASDNLPIVGLTLRLVAVMLLGYVLVAPLAYAIKGMDGLLAAAVAAAVCFAATKLSIAVEHRNRHGGPILLGLFWGMLYRMGLPIVAVLVIKWRSQTLWEAGAAIYLLVFFLVGLLARTLLTLPPTKPGS